MALLSLGEFGEAGGVGSDLRLAANAPQQVLSGSTRLSVYDIDTVLHSLRVLCTALQLVLQQMKPDRERRGP